MKKTFLNGLLTLLTTVIFCAAEFPLRQAKMPEIMPQEEDFTRMWWSEGFPVTIPGAPWRRCIQTGHYAFVMDTESMKISQLGPVAEGANYDSYHRDEIPEGEKASPADLQLTISANGKAYHCRAGGKWTAHSGPRLIESGRFLQRADVTDLVFAAADGEILNAETRFETVAWPDRLGMILSARPAYQPIQPGELSFGKIGGGFGLDGKNHWEVAHEAALDTAQFTLELWAFVPTVSSATDHGSAWLACKNLNEAYNGNFGLMLQDGKLQALMNIGGGRDGQFAVAPGPGHSVKMNAWNHLAMSYDGVTLRLYLNGQEVGVKKIGRPRVCGDRPLVIGRRGDNFGDGYHFRGVVDEVRYYNRPLSLEEVQQHFADPSKSSAGAAAVREWSFDPQRQSAEIIARESWKNAALEMTLTPANQSSALRQVWSLAKEQTASSDDWLETFVTLYPASFKPAELQSPVAVKATEFSRGTVCPVVYDPAFGCHRVNLDEVTPIHPTGLQEPSNDAIERVKLVLSNPTKIMQTTRLMVEKSTKGFHQKIGASVTGISAMLRDKEGNPSGIPVQLSKNWHHSPQAGVYAGQWFHGNTLLHLPPESEVELELTICYGHWGGLAAASHAQLCLIGWGSNGLWEQSALGSWGESICYDPEQAQMQSSITDVRPLMVKPMSGDAPWGWTNNMGGGDFFRFYSPKGDRMAHSSLQTTYLRQGPCLTEVTYAGRIGENLQQSMTASLVRSDDIVRGIYHIRLDVSKETEFSRFVIFQVGADTYNFTRERKLAIGDETGLLKEWDSQWVGDTPPISPIECRGRIPWMSLHQAIPSDHGASANRGIVIRAWNARLGGKNVAPWLAEHGTKAHGENSSTLDIVPPPGLTRLQPGDFVEATLEYIVMPQFAKDYYGPNTELRAALNRDENTWRMIDREARGNDLIVKMESGKVERLRPDLRVRTEQDTARLSLSGGLGFVAVSFTNLSSHRGYVLEIDGKVLDQSIHGNDFWQTDYDPTTRRWSRTYNLPVGEKKERLIQFRPKP